MAAGEFDFRDPIETGIVLLFTAIIIGIVLTNPGGIKGLLTGLGTFTQNTVGAFSGNQGFAARSNSTF